MNKFLATFLFALPAAIAEADPQLLGKTGLGHGYPLSGLGYRTGYPLSGYPDAAPGYLSPNYAGLAFPALGYSGFGLNPAHPLNTLAAPTTPLLHMVKREAEADAFYGPYSLEHTGYGAGYGLGSSYGYGGVGYPHIGYAGFGLGAPSQISPAAGIVPSASLNIAHLAPAAIPAIGGAYAGAGRYIGNSGVVHVAKREAEAHYGAYGLGYSGFPASAGYGYGGLSHSAYGYAAPGYHFGYGYPGLGFSGLGYTRHGYAGLGYAAPGNIGAPAEAPGQSSKSTSSSQTILGDAPAAIPAVRGGYAAAGRYLANSAGVVHAA